MILLALPGSTYIYQGDELGLHEVADLPLRGSGGPDGDRSTTEKGRDGCRVPLPWSLDGPSYGFGAQGGHLPQPDWFAAYAVSVQEADPDSTLNLYRRALALRGQLFAGTDLSWVESEPSGAALRARRRHPVRDQLRGRAHRASGRRGAAEQRAA